MPSLLACRYDPELPIHHKVTLYSWASSSLGIMMNSSYSISIAVGVNRNVSVPSPSWPSPLFPQQLTVPSFSIAHVCSSPADIATAVRPVPKLDV